MTINIKDFAAKYSLEPSDLIKSLVKAGLNIENDSAELTVDQMKLLKQQVSQKKSRGTLSLKVGGAKNKVEKEVVSGVVAPIKKEVSKLKIEEKIISKDSGVVKARYHSDADRARSGFVIKKEEAVKPSGVKKVFSKDEVDNVVDESKYKKSKVGKKALKTKKQKEEALGDMLAEESLSLRKSNLAQKFEIPAEPVAREVKIGEMIRVIDLANQLALKASVVVMQLMKLGVMVTVNQSIDQEVAMLVVEELGHKYVLIREEEEELITISNTDKQIARAPVVTVMGHVDHGKTTLLDSIRNSSVVDGESGGITQSIGAYLVDTVKGKVAFIDTPGHEAFASMRVRGAQCTDIVVLIVAADDGVMPQTIEAIQHAKAAEVPIVVAVNKIDKEGADPEKVKAELAKHDVLAESWGGDVLFQEVSAKTGKGISELLEHLAIQSEMLELKAPATGFASGLVLESVLDKGFGAVATLMVQSGCLKVGDIILIGSEYGRVRSIMDSHGDKLKHAGPSTPVKVTGLSGVPAAGELFRVMGSEKAARDYSALRKQKTRDKKIVKTKVKPLDQMFAEAQQGKEEVVLNIVLKADTHGSVEALAESVKKLSVDNLVVKVIGFGVGMINESDVNLAEASNALLVGFNVRADFAANKLLNSTGLDVFYCSVIYDLIEKVSAAAKGLMTPEFSEHIIGQIEVREVFRSSKFGAVAGGIVAEGLVRKNSAVRVLRDGIVIHNGVINSLRRSKDNVVEVKAGIECGVGIKDYTDIKAGDRLEAFVSKKNK